MPLSHLTKVTIIFWYCLIRSPYSYYPSYLKNIIFICFLCSEPLIACGCWSLNGLISYLHGENKAVHFIRLHSSEY